MPPSVPLSARSSIRWILPVLVLAVIAVPLLGSLDATGKPNRHPELRDFLPDREVRRAPRGSGGAGRQALSLAPSAAYLIVADVFETAILVMPRTGCVETVAADEMKIQEDGSIDLIVDATPCRLGKFRLEGADVVFRVKDATARLTPKPPLIGTALVRDRSSSTRPSTRGPRRSTGPTRPADGARGLRGGGARPDLLRDVVHLLQPLPAEHAEGRGGAEEVGLEDHLRVPRPARRRPPPGSRRRRPATGSAKLPTGLVFVDGRQIGRLEGRGSRARSPVGGNRREARPESGRLRIERAGLPRLVRLSV